MNIYVALLFLLTSSSTCEETSEGAGDGDGSDQATSLYSVEDPIYQVDNTNFTKLIFNQPRAFFIEFYSSWCGGCIAYAPTFKKFAKKVKDWSSVIQVTSVNCARQSNRDLCQEHGIDMFPTLKYFKSQSNSAKDGKKFEGEHYDIDNLAASLAWLVSEEALATVPQTWPSFEILNEFSDSLLHKYYTDGVKYVAVVLEKGKHIVGQQTILDFSSFPSIRILLAPVDHVLGRAFMTAEFSPPGLLVFSKNNPDPLFWSRKAMTHKEVKDKISELALENVAIPSDLGKVVHKPGASPVLQQIQPPDAASRSVQYQLHLSDLMAALSYMIRHEIGLKQSFNMDQLAALKNFFTLLTQNFPGRPPVRRFLHRLNEWIRSQDAPLNGRDWNSKVAQLQGELGRPLPTVNHWVSCKGSESKWRGYPCGLWNTFHSLTVAAYVNGSKDPQFSSVNVLEAVHGYVKHFFGCQQCSANFEKSAVRIPLEAKTPEDAVLWLWRSHNRANKFLKGTASEDVAFPKQQFPPVELCRQCYKDPSKARITEPDDLNWDQSAVLAFLIQFYTDVKSADMKETYGIVSFDEKGKKVISTQDLDLNPKFRKLGLDVKQEEQVHKKMEAEQMKENLKKLYNWKETGTPTNYRSFLNWTGLDTSLCLFLWVTSSGIVIAVFVYMRWRKSSYRYLKSFSSDYGKYRV